MTDEEKSIMEEWTVTQEEAKAEMYADEKHCSKCINFGYCVETAIEERCRTYRESYKDYLDGLAEGRKESLDKLVDLDITKENLNIKIRNLEKTVEELQLNLRSSNDLVEELTMQIEKMKSFIHSEIDFCVYCPLTNECKNEEGTCPYACATEYEQKNLLMDFIQKWEKAE